MACAAFWISSQTATKQDIDRTKGEGSLTGRSGAEAYADNFGDGTQSNDLDDLADGSHLRYARIRRGLSVAVSERQRNGRWANLAAASRDTSVDAVLPGIGIGGSAPFLPPPIFQELNYYSIIEAHEGDAAFVLLYSVIGLLFRLAFCVSPGALFRLGPRVRTPSPAPGFQ
jgi:hypothetical protein